MQLITMTMPMGDKGKNKTKNRNLSHNNSGITDNHSRPDGANLARRSSNSLENRDPGNQSQLVDSQLLDPSDTNLFSYSIETLDRDRLSSPNDPANISSLTNVSALLPIFSLPADVSCKGANEALPLPSQKHEVATQKEFSEGEDKKTGKLLEKDSTCSYAKSMNESHFVPLSGSDNNNPFSIETDRNVQPSVGGSATEDEMKTIGGSDENPENSEEVDENMNPTSGCKNNNCIIKSQFFKSSHALAKCAVQIDYMKSSPESGDRQEDRDFIKADSVMKISAAEVVINTSGQTVSKPHIAPLSTEPCSPQQLSNSELSNSLSNKNEHFLELKLQENTASSSLWQTPSVHERGVGESPIRTSLALRENAFNLPVLTLSVPYNNFDSTDRVAYNNHLHYEQQHTTAPHLYESERPERETDTIGETGNLHESLSRPDFVNDRDITKYCVFHNCEVSGIENISGTCDHYGVRRKDSDTRPHTSSPLALEDLDFFLSMLPSLCDGRDVLINHLIDDEVAMFRRQNEEDDEEEELATIDFSENQYIDVERPSNPVAGTLDWGGDEHFLPIFSDVFQD